MGEAVHLVPVELLGDEPPHPGLGEDLGEAGREAERVGQPHLTALVPEPAEVPALAVDDLADQRLT
jgi:hypothetical protein